MQTFLPVADFAETARILDTPRLGKQRVEVYQIIRVLDGVTKGWRNHPAVRMWRGYEPMLLHYGLTICAEWTGRGHADTVRDKLAPHLRNGELRDPPWLGDEDFHASHRSNLLRKDAQWYSRYGWSEPDDLPYVWPV